MTNRYVIQINTKSNTYVVHDKMTTTDKGEYKTSEEALKKIDELQKVK